MPRTHPSADAIDVQRLLVALEALTNGETSTRLPTDSAQAPVVEVFRRVTSLDLIPAWKPEHHAAELADNERFQRALDRRASDALHREIDIPKWRQLTRKQMALAVERTLNTESIDLPVGRTVELTNPLGRSLEYVRTPGGWERLRELPELQSTGVEHLRRSL